MNPQRLRHRVKFEEQIEARDPVDGSVTVTWQTVYLDSDTDLSAVPAEVLTGPGKELIASSSKHAETTARINLRWFPGMSPKWRVLWDGRVYNITSIETDATGRLEWRLRCQDGLTDGR